MKFLLSAWNCGAPPWLTVASERDSETEANPLLWHWTNIYQKQSTVKWNYFIFFPQKLRKFLCCHVLLKCCQQSAQTFLSPDRGKYMGLGLLFYFPSYETIIKKKIKWQKSHRLTHSELLGRFLELFIWKCMCQLGKYKASVLFWCLFQLFLLLRSFWPVFYYSVSLIVTQFVVKLRLLYLILSLSHYFIPCLVSLLLRNVAETTET